MSHDPSRGRGSSAARHDPGAGSRENRPLPIRRIALFKHGVGYFERTGVVHDDASVDLLFKAAEMNDVLKSLTTLDLDNGLIASISYESVKPVEKQLQDTSLDLADDNALTNLLSQGKGARVTVNIGAKEFTGVVIGIETSARKEENATISSHRLVLLVNGQSLRSYDLLDVTSIEFLDEGLRDDLRHVLDILISAKRKDLKKLTIFARGEGERRVLASYVVETPVWKTSYRVLLGKDRPLVQGWALVDNTQDEDWDDVELTLVAGLPISFIHDLYSPRYRQRPIVRVQEEEAYAPPVLEGAEESFREDVEAGGDPFMAVAVAPMSAMEAQREFRRAPPVAAKAVARERSVQVQTRTAEVGDLFHYEISNPVTVKRGQSALVPILQTRFDGKRVAIYNTDVRDKNPMSAILLKNDTGSMLEGGPMTVMEDEHYVGEAMLETLKPNEERIVPFSVELGCAISIDNSKRYMPYYLSRLAHGVLHLHRYVVDTRTYIVNNKNDKPLDLFIDHRFNAGWDLVDTQAPVERTENFYRFRIEAAAGTTTRFAVSEKLSTSESIELRGADLDTVAAWVKSSYIDAGTGERVRELIRLSETLGDLQRQVEAVNQDIDAIFKNQERLRQNLQALGKSEGERGLRERYVTELSNEEDRLRNLRESKQRLKEQRKKADQGLRDLIASLEFERKLS